MSRVAITGASGLLGGNLAAELVRAGHSVVATRRGSTKIAHLDDVAIDWRDADLGSTEALAKAFAGCEAVFHCAGAVSTRRDVTPEMRDANVDGTTRIIDACLAAKVGRLVHTSSVVAVGLTRNGTPADETTPFNYAEIDPGLCDAYTQTKHESEQLVTAAANRLDSVIVNPGYMFGPRDARPSSGQIIVKVAKRQVPGWTPGYNNFVDVRDVARGMIAAWQRGKRGERYILAGYDMTYRECFEHIAQVAGVKPPRFGVPKLFARALGRWGDWRESRGHEPLVNTPQILYAYTDKFRFTSAKAERELGYTYGPLRVAIRDALDWFRSHGML